MDGHDLHPPSLPSRHAGELVALLQDAAQVADEIEQSGVSPALTAAGVLVEGQQIFLPPLSASHGPEDAQQAGAVVQLPQQLGGGQVRCQQTQAVQFFQKVHTGRVAGVRPVLDALVEIPLRAVGAQ